MRLTRHDLVPGSCESVYCTPMFGVAHLGSTHLHLLTPALKAELQYDDGAVSIGSWVIGSANLYDRPPAERLNCVRDLWG